MGFFGFPLGRKRKEERGKRGYGLGMVCVLTVVK